MSEHLDAIVIGMGPGGEVAASRLLAAGRRVAVIERELIGGECAYWACVPSKTLLRSTEARSEAARAAGLSTPALHWPDVREHRDVMVRHLDDSAQVDGYRRKDALVFKGAARLTAPGHVAVGDTELSADHIILATGSEPVRPPIDGLDGVPVWTNREATGLTEVPARALLVGGSAVAAELGQLLARLGSRVTVVERADRLLAREEPRIGELVAKRFDADGIDVRVGAQVSSVRRDGDDTVATLDDGSTVRTDVVVLATGRRPRTDGLGLDRAGVAPGERGELPVDEHGRVADGMWAVGDVTGTAMFTHVAKYQANLVADAILGAPRAADYTAVPRVVFTDPEVAAVGLTVEQARAQGLSVATTELDLTGALARPWTYERDPSEPVGNHLGLVADRDRRTLVGAWAFAPLAGEWIHTAALVIRHRLPLRALAESIPQFPTYTEGYARAADDLLRELLAH